MIFSSQLNTPYVCFLIKIGVLIKLIAFKPQNNILFSINYRQFMHYF